MLEKYFEYLKGKRVAIVGPAGYMQGRGLGKKIDSYDVIVRMNKSFFIKFPADYGGRTDVLYQCLWRRTRKEIPALKKYLNNDSLKWLVLKPSQGTCPVKYIKDHFEKNCVFTSWELIGELTKQIDKATNTGTVAIFHLLKSELKSLDVYGFDYYASGVYTGYRADGSQENTQAHDNKSQVLLLGSIKDKRIKFDDHFKELYDATVSSNTGKNV